MFRKYRISNKLTQEKLADLTNLDLRTVQRIENEERYPSIETFAKLVKVLNIKDEDVIKYIKHLNVKTKKKEREKINS